MSLRNICKEFFEGELEYIRGLVDWKFNQIESIGGGESVSSYGGISVFQRERKKFVGILAVFLKSLIDF